MILFPLPLGERSYPIRIGAGALSSAALPGGKAAVVSDETVWALHGGTLETALRRAGVTFSVVLVSPGEKSKSLTTLHTLYQAFCRMELRRSDFIIAFGGGVVGDLAGFAAATYMRGVPFIQIPTTLLAQVDSSVGGKVAVNLEEGKNLVGSFYQPRMVIADTTLLETLPPREFAAGMAEVIKYAAIGSQELLSLLENAPVSASDGQTLETIVHICCRAKASFVAKDEYDTGDRQMLNFGHTFGHAIEKLYTYERYNHGEAVALGMMLAAETGVRLGETEPDTPQRLAALLKQAGLPLGTDCSVAQLSDLMTGDKKNADDQITLVLTRRLGERPFLRPIFPAQLQSLWQKEDVQ